MAAAIQIEFLRVLAALLLGSLVGELVGAALWGALMGLLAISAYHFRYAYALLKWLDKPKKNELPDGYGIWRLINQASYERWRQARKRKKQLSAIVKEFRASTAALPDAAVVLDSELGISWFNQAAGELLALNSTRDKGLPIANLLRHPVFVRYLNASSHATDGIEIPGPTNAEQTLWVRVIDYGRGQRLLIARDITGIKQAEQSRRDFVANASHELRTPLTVVRGYLDMMRDDSDQGSDSPLASWKDPLAEMSRQAGRMQKIIADLLKLANLESRSGKANQGTVDMAALIGASMDEAHILSQDKHELIRKVDAKLCLRGHQSELHSVISNLLSNALRYTPEGGSVTVEWCESQNGGAILSVRDTGIGISAVDLPRLTERFYRADAARSRETGGTGLGLAIVKHALERHNARLSINSSPGKGSTFVCEFPSSRVLIEQEIKRAG